MNHLHSNDYSDDIRWSDRTHPVDMIEPEEQPNFSPQGREIVSVLVWIDEAPTLCAKARPLIHVLNQLRNAENSPVDSGASNDTASDEGSSSKPTISHVRVQIALMEILAWAARGRTEEDIGLRFIAIMRALGIAPWAGFSLSEIGALKSISKQRVDDLEKEFVELYMRGI